MTVFQNFRQGGAAAGMGSDYSGSGSFRLVQGAFYHLMGHGIGKEHKQIRTSQLFFQIRRHLGKYFCFTIIFFANLFKVTVSNNNMIIYIIRYMAYLYILVLSTMHRYVIYIIDIIIP